MNAWQHQVKDTIVLAGDKFLPGEGAARSRMMRSAMTRAEFSSQQYVVTRGYSVRLSIFRR